MANAFKCIFTPYDNNLKFFLLLEIREIEESVVIICENCGRRVSPEGNFTIVETSEIKIRNKNSKGIIFGECECCRKIGQ